MYKDYLGIFKDLRKMQDQLWEDSMANFPGAVVPRDMNAWQQKTLGNVNSLMERAVKHSMDLQRGWLEQWVERAGQKNLKPKVFAELSTDARESTQRWLDNQNQLWEQWLQVLKDSGSKKAPDFGQWESAVQESFERQAELLNEWSELGGVKKLSFKELGKLTDQIEKSMEKAIETQQRMWLHWFENVSAPPAKSTAASRPAAKKKTTKAAAKPARKVAAKKAPAKTAAKGHDDLKQITGIGPGLEKKLKDSGIKTLKQIAELSDEDITHLEEEIIKFSGRINRDKWVQQAKKLTR